MSFTAPQLPQHVYGEANVRLGRLEVEDGCTILLAIESGSRAWGFPSPDSDNDVRFIYARPASQYLGLNQPEDFINKPLDGLWDIEGWDIRKALGLLVKGNATAAEWLQSPLIYRENGPVPYRLRDLIKRHASPQASAKHFYGMTNTCYEKDIRRGQSKTTETLINQKKYLYAIRGASSIAWIERYNEIPPMTLPALMSVDLYSLDIRHEIQALLDRKASLGEIGIGPRIEKLDFWIESKIAWVKDTGLHKVPADPLFEQEANKLLLEALGF